MDRNRRSLVGLWARLAVFGGAALLPACSVERTVDILTSPIPTQITVEPKGLALEVGRTATLRVTVVPAGDNRAEWATSNAAVASVDAFGKVTCLTPGGVVITVTSVPNPTLRDVAGIACLPANPGPQPSTPPSTAPPTNGGLISISTGSLSFQHTVGASPCPQLVGEFTVTNNALLSRTFVSLRSGNGAIEMSPSEFQLEAGASQRVRVIFNCSTQNSFSTVIRIDANNGSGNTDTDHVEVQATIR